MATTRPDRRVFVDTAFLVAILNRHDRHHAEAKALAETWADRGTSLHTTDAVRIEVANFFARSQLRAAAVAGIARLRTTVGWTVEPISTDLLSRGERRYAAHPDKAWSLTDCISMEAMKENGISAVATTDHHFIQAGFRILLGP